MRAKQWITGARNLVVVFGMTALIVPAAIAEDVASLPKFLGGRPSRTRIPRRLLRAQSTVLAHSTAT